ncbi:CU044_5270 family protein [Micromonospora sp. NPDC004336]
MNIDELVRRGRPDSTGWARSEAGRRALDGVVTAASAGEPAEVGPARASRPALRWSFLATGLAGAAAAGVLAVSIVAAPQDAGRDVPPVAGAQPGATHSAGAGTTLTARDILLAAAGRAEQAPAETGRYWHVKTVDVYGPTRVGTGADAYSLLRSSVNESWDAREPRDASWTGFRDLGARPRAAEDERAWRAAGSPTTWRLDVDGPSKLVLSTRPGKGDLSRDPEPPRYLEDLGELTLEQVRQLPAEPGALRGWVTDRIRADKDMGNPAPGSALSDRLLFGFLSRLLLDTPAPPKVRAAAFRVLADIPGVRGLGTVQDERGRSGQGVEFRSGAETEWLIVDTATHRLLASRIVSTPKGAPAYGGKESSTLVLTAEWSDAAPRVPALPQR